MPFRKKFRKKRTPPAPKVVFACTFISFIILVILSFWLVDRGIKPTLMDIAEIKTDEFATRAINAAVEFTEDVEFDNLIEEKYDHNGEVTSTSWNSAAINRILRTSTDRVEYYLHNMNKGATIDTEDPNLKPEDYGNTASDLAQRDPTVVEIPIGQATGNSVLANLGPKIPVHFEIVGNIKTDVIHEVEEFGINSALYKLYISVNVNVQIVMPFSSSVSEVETKIFITSGIVNGKVPEFYSGKGEGPSISIPKDSLKK